MFSGGRDGPREQGDGDFAAPPWTAHGKAAVLSLKQALRRARFDEAERSAVIMDLRAARIGRLEALQEALAPLIVQIPDDAADLFDVAIMPGPNPRLFIDMIGFVEMGRDTRLYRFIQDTRTGRVVLAESETVASIVEAVTNYVARRLLERDKALAADLSVASDPRPIEALEKQTAALGARAKGFGRTPGTKRAKDRGQTNAAGPGTAPPRGTLTGALAVAFAFIINILGSMTFFGLLALGAWFVWERLHVGG